MAKRDAGDAERPAGDAKTRRGGRKKAVPRKSHAGGPPQTTSSRRSSKSPSPFRPLPNHPNAPAQPFSVPAALARDFSKRLRAWFRRHGRDLPWRRTRDPYRVLVSELMLQQTQVSRVVDYYARFLERFPSLTHLAEAPQTHVLDAWSGLGYYARARNLHALALRVTRDGGTIPAEPNELRELPGIGAYTAGAVSSFAYEQRAALVDTNVARVLARVFAPQLSPKRPRDLTQLWRIAELVLPARGSDAWTHNQAIMELGALVCTARIAHCTRCPVAKGCLSRDRATTRATTAIEGTAQQRENKSGRKRRRSLPPTR